jgi:peptide/nickel transport system substrate-binding protein
MPRAPFSFSSLRGVVAYFVLLFLLVQGCGGPAEQPAEPARVALPGDPITLDPHLQDDAITNSLLFNVYEGLTAFDADMSLEPALARRWENLDDHTWRFRLRPGVLFHDGRPLEAADVVASLERARDHERSLTAGYLVSVEEVRAVDPLTVELKTREPTAILVNKLAFVAIVPRDAPEEITEPVGTGPYRLSAAGESYRLEAWGEWWGDGVEVERVELVPVAAREDRRQALVEGEVDLAINLRPAPDLPKPNEYRQLERERLSVAYLSLRSDRPPFDDHRVRLALHLALDRRALVREMFNGQAEPAGQLVNRHVFGHVPELEAPHPDPVRARELLEEAGQVGLELELAYLSSLPIEPLKRQLEAVGLRVREASLAWAELLPRLEAGEFDLYVGGLLSPTGDASDLLDSDLHSPDPERGYGGGNFYGYSNPELDILIEESSTLLDPRKRLEHLQRCLRLVSHDLPLIPLVVPFQVDGIRGDLRWRQRLDGLFRAADLGRGGD